MIRIDNEDYEILATNMVQGEIFTLIRNIETGEEMNLSHSKKNGYMLWVPYGTVLDPGIKAVVPQKVEINVFGEDGKGVPLNMAKREFRFVPYKTRQFFN